MTQRGANGEQGQDTGPADDQQSQLKLEMPYIKSTVAPTFHVDGVFGGITTRGMLYMAFFSEHVGIPASVTISLDRVTRTYKEQPVASNAVQEVGAEVIMNIDLARSLREWLDDKINQFDREGPGERFDAIPQEQQP